MAIFVGEPPFVGTRGGITIYKVNGQYRVRRCNRLNRKRVKTAPEFTGLRRYAHWLKMASPLASAIYATLPANRQRKHYQQLTGKAIQWLQEGLSVNTIAERLQEAAVCIRRQLLPPGVTPRRQRRLMRKRVLVHPLRAPACSSVQLPVHLATIPLLLQYPPRKRGRYSIPPPLPTLLRPDI